MMVGYKDECNIVCVCVCVCMGEGAATATATLLFLLDLNQIRCEPEGSTLWSPRMKLTWQTAEPRDREI